MKKFLSVLMASALVLTGCASENNKTTDNSTSTEQPKDMYLEYDDSYIKNNELEAKMDEYWEGLDKLLVSPTKKQVEENLEKYGVSSYEEYQEKGGITGAGYVDSETADGLGAVILAAYKGKVIFEKAYGNAYTYDVKEGSEYNAPVYEKVEHPRAMTTDTLFDLASVTKVMATTQSIMILVDRGLIDVNEKVAKYLPGFEKNGKENITIAQLLTHSSGLPQWRPTYLYCKDKAEQLEFIKNLELDPEFKTDGSEPKYSGFSFMTLGYVVEAVDPKGRTMDQFVEEEVYKPLGMKSTTYCPLEHGFTKDQIAATSLGNPYEYMMTDEKDFPKIGYDCTGDEEAFNAFKGWRHGALIGETNDGNSGMATGGVAGHAGLYSTAKDLAILLQCMLDGGEYNGVKLYSKDTVKLFTTKHTKYAENHDGKLSEEFGYGFKLDQSWMGNSATENAFGHDGFTGTTVYADPDHDYIFICLTNKMQAGFRHNGTPAGEYLYYYTNGWVSWNMNEIVKTVLGI